MRRAFSLSLSFIAVVLVGCPSSNDARPASDGSASLADAALADAAADAEADDEVRPVYDTSANAPVDPLAQRFCKSLSEVRESHRAKCCNTTAGVVVTDECVRMLSAALISKAATLAPAAVDVCAVALEKRFDGCDWVGPFPAGVPDECMGVIKGNVAQGGKCRSTLECAGTLRCHGVGPTHASRCAPAKKDGEPCGGSVDPLAGFTQDTAFDQRHPECEKKCIQHRCAAPLAEGGACGINPDCADGLACVDKKCKKAVVAKLGEPCPAGACEAPASCILGKCAVKKSTGEACTQDFECKAGCVRADGGSKGKCGPRCDVR